MTVYYAPKHFIGDYVLTQDTVCADGNTHPVTVEKFMTPIGEMYMYLILVAPDNKRTTFRLYKTPAGAIRAASKAKI